MEFLLVSYYILKEDLLIEQLAFPVRVLPKTTLQYIHGEYSVKLIKENISNLIQRLTKGTMPFLWGLCNITFTKLP